jgi:formylglycine-generating enzyme required for sulfatase activity
VTKEKIIDISIIDNQMVKIPDGEIALRDDRTKERWTVEIKPVLLAKFPVTQELFFAITNENPSTI